jgi:hypothetical protein
MIPYNAKTKFEEMSKESYFIRVDETHPLNLWIGVDKSGQKAIRFVGTFAPTKLSGTSSIQIKQFVLGDQKCIQFSLSDPESADLYYKFCDDLIDSSRDGANQSGGYNFVVTRFSRWKKMFVTKKDILPETSIMGLVGELYFLFSFMMPKYGQQKSISSWSASDPTVKDFSIDNTWYEVKTTGTRSQTVKISSIQQLEFSSPGNLVIIRLEKMAESYQGKTLNNMVLSLINSISSPDDCEQLQTKLNLRGYTYNEKYDQYVYEVSKMTQYFVDDGFPSLHSKDLNEAITNAEYELLIEKIKPYIEG